MGEHKRNARSIFSLTGLGSNWASDLIISISAGGKAWEVDGEFYFEDYSEYHCVSADNFTEFIDGNIGSWKCQVGYKVRRYKMEIRENKVNSWIKFPNEETTLNKVPAGWFSKET